MIPDESDTIVAVASPRAGGARGVVRMSGPGTTRVLRGMIVGGEPWPAAPRGAGRYGDTRFALQLHGRRVVVSGDLFVWPDERSYTRQPAAELHTLGSAPVVEGLVRSACDAGARLAEPGEFTLRAFLAGRIDLTQAEAVLGVIDARGDYALQTALGQLAGGLSAPLQSLREDLLQLLADLEAGLDFVEEEDIRFVEPDELAARLTAAAVAVRGVLDQVVSRSRAGGLPRVALAGPPNAGKSTLFNRVRAQWGGADQAGNDALVSPQAGTTRDSLVGDVDFNGYLFQLVDTAGIDFATEQGPGSAAQRHASRDAGDADLTLFCLPANDAAGGVRVPAGALRIVTKSDLLVDQPDVAGVFAVSGKTGDGIEKLLQSVANRLDDDDGPSRLIAATADRCRQSLAGAAEALGRARAVGAADQHDLVAIELRAALDELGQVVGAVVTDDVLDRIFSRFCIGK